MGAGRGARLLAPCLSCGQLAPGQRGGKWLPSPRGQKPGVHLSTLTGHQTAPHQDLSKPTGPGAATALSQTRARAPHATGAAGLVWGCSKAGEAGRQGAPSRLSFSKPTTCSTQSSSPGATLHSRTG